eukprot:741116_1
MVHSQTVRGPMIMVISVALIMISYLGTNEHYSLCTWNPETNENDTAFVFINDNALWKSAPQYEFVHEFNLNIDFAQYLLSDDDEKPNAFLSKCRNEKIHIADEDNDGDSGSE